MKWILIAVLFAGFSWTVSAQTSKKDTPVPANIKPEQIPSGPKLDPLTIPPPDWLADREKLIAENDAIVRLKAENGIDKLEDDLNKQSQALIARVPKGYVFNPSTVKFDPISAPAPTAVPAK